MYLFGARNRLDAMTKSKEVGVITREFTSRNYRVVQKFELSTFVRWKRC